MGAQIHSRDAEPQTIQWRRPSSAAKPIPVTDFLDVTGASGARYRFRRAVLDALPVNAGNVVAVDGKGGKARFLLCAATRSLARAEATLREALSDQHSAAVYVRLNVARTVREAEHADIVAAVEPLRVLDDLG